MQLILWTVDPACDSVVWLMLRAAGGLEESRRAVHRRAMALRASLRRHLLRWGRLRHSRGGLEGELGSYLRRRAWNRTPDSVEEDVVSLHVECPHLGTGQLAALARRVLGFGGARATVRRILLRRRGLVVELEEARRRARRRTRMQRALELWGVDITLVWLLGSRPVWVQGVVDYHGSRLVALERLR